MARLTPPPPSRLQVVQRELAQLLGEVLAKLDKLADAVRDDHFYDAVEIYEGIDPLIERWADLGDEINYREGYEFLVDNPELRENLLAWGREQFDGVEVPHDA